MNSQEILTLARKIRAYIEANAEDLTDDQALDFPQVFPVWMPGESYPKDYRVRYGEHIYKCLQPHTAQVDWLPTYAASLWAQVLTATEEDTIAEWQQPDSTNAYMRGDKVLYDGIVYESVIDYNVWSPVAYPMGWQAV